MTTFEASTTISSSADHVWATLLDTTRWPEWDRSLQRVEGPLGPEGRITIHVEGQSRPFKLRVVDWEPGLRLTLRGGMPLGLFTGTRAYELTAVADGTAVSMVERYTGPLASVFGKRLPDLQPSFDDFVAGWRDAAQR
ncbi:MAG: SRPBCC domain-containing protein [Acidimicrobiales bacterium]|nr:SRPBCC domain-containing protein [Acidimicrobiales bacterium]